MAVWAALGWLCCAIAAAAGAQERGERARERECKSKAREKSCGLKSRQDPVRIQSESSRTLSPLPQNAPLADARVLDRIKVGQDTVCNRRDERGGERG